MVRRVVFDSSLYLPEAVEAAVLAYREHATIRLSRNGKGTVATFAGAASDADLEEEVVLSFCNHALFETVTRRSRASIEGG